MLKLTFKQTQAEVMVRAASTVLFNALSRSGYPLVSLSQLSEEPQYGFTASAEHENIGPKLVRITDLQDGGINWNTVPYCKCDKPEQYLLEANDILFARTGATTGKTHLVKQAENAVFASYLIRLRPKSNVLPEYLYFFFQSDAYWSQISEEKEGSAQPNVNGKKLINIQIPLVDDNIQSEISKFLAVVRERQDGSTKQLPNLPPPLEDQRRVVLRIEELAAKVEEARGLRSEAVREAELLLSCTNSHILDSNEWQVSRLETVLTEPPRNGLSPQRVVESDGRQMLRINAVSSSLTRYVDLSAHKLVDVSDDVARPFTLQNDDVFIVRYNGDINRLAKAAIFKATESSNVVYPDKLMRLRADLTKILPDFLVYALSSRRVRTQIEELGITTAGQIGISGKNAKSFLISVPPIPEQRHIVSYLDDLQARVDQLKRLQSGTEAEFNALLPSILDKAFKGEL